MAERQVKHHDYIYTDFVYEGEALALEYPSGELIRIPDDKVWMFLKDSITVDGDPCSVVLKKSPLTRLDIVVIES